MTQTLIVDNDSIDSVDSSNNDTDYNVDDSSLYKFTHHMDDYCNKLLEHGHLYYFLIHTNVDNFDKRIDDGTNLQKKIPTTDSDEYAYAIEEKILNANISMSMLF